MVSLKAKGFDWARLMLAEIKAVFKPFKDTLTPPSGGWPPSPQHSATTCLFVCFFYLFSLDELNATFSLKWFDLANWIFARKCVCISRPRIAGCRRGGDIAPQVIQSLRQSVSQSFRLGGVVVVVVVAVDCLLSVVPRDSSGKTLFCSGNSIKTLRFFFCVLLFRTLLFFCAFGGPVDFQVVFNQIEAYYSKRMSKEWDGSRESNR